MKKTIYRKPGVLEITKGWDFAYKISQYHDQYTLIISLLYFTLFISLPCFSYDFDKWDRGWGLYWYETAFWFNWGEKTKCVRMFWGWKHVRHSVLMPNGEMKNITKDEMPWRLDDGRLVEKHPYSYVLENGNIQNRTATIYTEEREWRRFKTLRWPRKISRSIHVDFDGEVGERTGSWKGGCVGCGYDILPGETMKQTLMRMERERIFK